MIHTQRPRPFHLNFAFALVLAILAGGCTAPSGDKVYQYAPFHALAAGHFDGDLAVSQLKHHDYIGLGTFNRLDGEMIVLDEVYQIRSDGQAVVAGDSLRTPFSEVTRLRLPAKRTFDSPMSLPELQRALEALAGDDRGSILACRIDGVFASIRVRSVRAQDQPYPTLAEAVKQQKVYECRQIRGTIVAFRFPTTIGNMNVQGWHMHFIDADRKVGGHVLDVQPQSVHAAVQKCSVLELTLPPRDLTATSAPAAGHAAGPE